MTNDESFPTLVYQYVDFAGSPDDISQWKTDDLRKLISMAQAELQRRGDEPRGCVPKDQGCLCWFMGKYDQRPDHDPDCPVRLRRSANRTGDGK